MRMTSLCLFAVRLIGILVVGSVLLVQQACDKAEPKSLESKVESEHSLTKTGVLITDEAESARLEEFAIKFCEASINSNVDLIMEMFDHDALIDITFDIPEVGKSKAKSEIRSGFMKGVTKNPGGIMATSLGQPLEFLRLRDVDGQTRVLCRIVSEGLNYYEFIPTKQDDGSYVFTDMYSFLSGELMSTTFQKIMIPILASATQTPLQKIFAGRKGGNVGTHIMKLQEITNAVKQGGDLQKALGVFRSLPESVQNDRTVLQIYLQLGGAIMGASEDSSDTVVYEDAMSRFESRYSDHPAFFLIGIDYYLLKGDMENYYATLDSLDEAIGGDPFLDVYRGAGLAEEGKIDEALTFYDSAIEKCPHIEDAYWNAVDAAVTAKRFSKTASYLTDLCDKFEIEMELEGEPYYAEFIKSKAGAAWWKDHQNQKGE